MINLLRTKFYIKKINYYEFTSLNFYFEQKNVIVHFIFEMKKFD